MKKYIATNPKGKSFIIKDGLNNFCKKFNLHHADMIKVVNEQRMSHKRWTCKLID
jgi:hypothetical protein